MVYDVERGAPPVLAAHKAGVKEKDIEAWLEKGRAGKEPFRAFADEIDAALHRYEMALAGVVHFAIFESAKPDVSTAKWALERRFPKRWRAKDEVAPIIPVKHDGKAYSSEELRLAASLQDEAAARAKAKLETERKNSS